MNIILALAATVFTFVLNYVFAVMHNFPKPDDLIEITVIFVVYFIVFRWALSTNKG